jgi:hypothetical protein
VRFQTAAERVLSGEVGKPDLKANTVLTFAPLHAAGCKTWLSSVLKLEKFNLDFLDEHAPLRARILTHFVHNILKSGSVMTQEQLEACFLEALALFTSDASFRLAAIVRTDPRTFSLFVRAC